MLFGSRYDSFRDRSSRLACRRARQGQQDGRSAGTFDLMIAAHAHALDATLVTATTRSGI
jgi:predicted nucleic acid-binding protein